MELDRKDQVGSRESSSEANAVSLKARAWNRLAAVGKKGRESGMDVQGSKRAASVG